MLFKIISNLKSKLLFNEFRRSCQRCARLQEFYSSLKKSPTYNVAFMPTAQSFMSHSNTISGWYDTNLTEKGKIESRCAGHILLRDGYHFDIGFCSLLSRDLGTLCHLYQEMGLSIDVHQHWRLNTRAMGEFTGQKSTKLTKKYGYNFIDDSLFKYRGVLPKMTPHHIFYENIRNDKRYENVLPKEKILLRESLPLLQRRVLSYWTDVIGKQIKLNKKVLVVADIPVLRVLIKYLNKISDEDIMKLRIRRACPFIYTLDHNLQPIRGKSMQYLDNLVPIKLNEYVIACSGT